MVSKFALNFFCYPFSNFSSVRLWRALTLEKPDLRSNLSFNSIHAIVLSHEFIKNQGGIQKLEPCEKMLLRLAMNSEIGTVRKNAVEVGHEN